MSVNDGFHVVIFWHCYDNNAFPCIVGPTKVNAPKYFPFTGGSHKIWNKEHLVDFDVKLFLYIFLTPPALPGVPVVWFHVRQTYSLRSLAFKRVTHESTISCPWFCCFTVYLVTRRGKRRGKGKSHCQTLNWSFFFKKSFEFKKLKKLLKSFKFRILSW